MTTLTPALSQRQRAAPPIDRRSYRRGLAAGGYDVSVPRTLAPGLESELARYPGTSNDSRVQRERIPWYSVGQYRPAAESWVNWTEAGPPRAELHMRTTEYRPEAGSSTSRYPFIPSAPTGGRHTMIPSGPGGTPMTRERYVGAGLPQMRGARTDRLSSARYTGQSYSQTTAVQGRAYRR